jgi:AcrR family transcriptional regulator
MSEPGERVLRLPYGEGRRALLEAVVQVVLARGFRGLSDRAVAQEAGVTHGLVRYHFPTREGMIADALEAKAAATIAQAHILPSGELDDFFSGLLAFSEEDERGHLFINELILEACRSPELKPYVREVYEQCFAVVEGALAEAGVEPRPGLVRLVFGACAGLALQQIFFGSTEWSEESLDELRRILRLLSEADAGPAPAS